MTSEQSCTSNLSKKMLIQVYLKLYVFVILLVYQNRVLCKIYRQTVQKNIIIHKNVYIWNNEIEDFMSLSNETYSRNNDNFIETLEGKTVHVLAHNMLPYIASNNYSNNLGGFLGEIFNIIQDAFKFKYVVTSIEYDDGLQIIEEGKADVMLAAVVYKEDLKNVYFSQPYFYNWYLLYLRAPQARVMSTSYLKTFNAQLWIFSVTLFAILTMSVWLTSQFLNRAYLLEPHISIPSCFLGIVSGFINQGFDLKLRSYSARIQVIFALILGVVLYSAMNAVLVAQLAVFDTPYPFQSLHDIAKKRTHSLCLRSNSFVYNNFTDERRNILPEWRGILNNKNCLDINNYENITKIICNDRVIILENRVVMSALFKNFDIPCEISVFHQKYFKKENCFLMLNSFKGKRLIDSFMKKMRSTGVLQRLEDEWVRRDKLVDVNIQSTHQVTMDHIIGILYLYISVIFISVIILGFEILHKKYYNYNVI